MIFKNDAFSLASKNFIFLSNFHYKKFNLRPEIEGEWGKWFVSVHFGKEGVTEPKFGTQKKNRDVKCHFKGLFYQKRNFI